MRPMDEQEAWRQRVRREQGVIERLRTAAFRLEAAQEERTWAIVAAHQQGLPIRRIAAAAGLSATRVHQLLAAAATAGIPAWLSRLREPGAPAAPTACARARSSRSAAMRTSTRRIRGRSKATNSVSASPSGRRFTTTGSPRASCSSQPRHRRSAATTSARCARRELSGAGCPPSSATLAGSLGALSRLSHAGRAAVAAAARS